MKVLIVDDSKTIRLLVKEMLEELKHEVDSAEDGQVAVDKFKSGENFDLILLDWNMPNMSGLEFLELNQKDGLVNCPIVMMTTENAPEKIMKALELGAKEYIMKPFTQDILESKLQRVS